MKKGISRGPQPTEWPLEPHTIAKHDLIRRYLGGWFPVLGSYNGRVLFLDGFAGPGAYSGGEKGSPLVALETLLDHPRFTRLKCEFVFMFVEGETDRASALEDRLKQFVESRGGLPPNVKYEVIAKGFRDAGSEILKELSQQKANLAPTFAFIDPFGFSGVPLELIRDLLAFDKCEVFFNFMYDYINRFATAGNVDRHLTELFGTDVYKQAKGKTPFQRKAFLTKLYEDQLKIVCKFEYVQHFSMIRSDGHTVYTLFFGTRNITGLRIMKDAMWRVDPGNGASFSDRLAGEQVLFGDHVDVGPLRRELLRHFACQTVGVEEIERYTLTQTPYSASHWNRLTLAPMERQGLVSVPLSPRMKRFTFPKGTLVTFPGFN